MQLILCLCLLSKFAHALNVGRVSSDTLELSPLPFNVGRNVFHTRESVSLNEYANTYFNDPDTGLSTAQLIESRGFGCERHWITTNDGYILSAYRLVNPFRTSSRPYPVLIVSNVELLMDEYMWNYGGAAIPPRSPASVHNGSVLNANIAFSLANHGYDVWLFHYRGSDGSLNHTTLDPLSPEFWKYSNDELALQDIPAAIDYVRSFTHFRRSSTSLNILMTLSRRTEYNDVLKPIILLTASFLSTTSKNLTLLDQLAVGFLQSTPGPFVLRGRIVSNTLTLICAPPTLDLCLQLTQRNVGIHYDLLNQTRIPVYLSHVAQNGFSNWMMAHEKQLDTFCDTRMYNYGSESENIRRYGSKEPPTYDVKKIRNKFIVIFYGRNDLKATEANTFLLINSLPVPVETFAVPDHWGHGDSNIARDSGRVLPPQIIMTLRRTLTKKDFALWT